MHVMWLLKGIQSGIAHYLACQPCEDRKKRKQMVEESRKVRIREEQTLLLPDRCHPEFVYREGVEYKPGMYYPQPAAGEVNKAWAQAIPRNPVFDPVNPPKYMAKPNRTIGIPKSAFKRSIRHSSKEPLDTAKSAPKTEKQDATARGAPDAQAVADGRETVQEWKRKTRQVYEREDETLLTDEEYVGAKNQIFKDLGFLPKNPNLGYPGLEGPDKLQPPPVNDHHAATTANPAANPAGISWIFQSLPPVEVMDGKEPPAKRKIGGHALLGLSNDPNLRDRVVAGVMAGLELEEEEEEGEQQ